MTSDASSLSSSRLRGIQKHDTPVVGTDYVYGCLEKGVLLPMDEYKLDTSSPDAPAIPKSTRAIFSLLFVTDV